MAEFKLAITYALYNQINKLSFHVEHLPLQMHPDQSEKLYFISQSKKLFTKS